MDTSKIRRIDLTNKQFGSWHVIRFADKKNGAARWLCRCTCGVERIVCGSALRRRRTTSCRCANILPVSVRFWKRVDKNGSVPSHRPELGRCWLWTGGRHSKRGYGVINEGRRKAQLVHRISWELHYGKIPPDACVLHECDQGALGCVRPTHLRLGTKVQNNRDMVARGRSRGAVGTKNTNARLTDQDVFRIRIELANGVSWRALAKKFGVCKTSIGNIYHNRTWTHL